jgi:hypothetical protein
MMIMMVTTDERRTYPALALYGVDGGVGVLLHLLVVVVVLLVVVLWLYVWFRLVCVCDGEWK